MRKDDNNTHTKKKKKLRISIDEFRLRFLKKLLVMFIYSSLK